MKELDQPQGLKKEQIIYSFGPTYKKYIIFKIYLITNVFDLYNILNTIII